MELVVNDPEDILRIADALSSMTRINILKIVAESPKSVTELSEELQMTKGNVSSQLAVLESAGLIDVEYSNGIKGVKKIVKNKYDKIIINLKSST